ncbi:hypothetical protein JW826_01845 [Candidatus Woesearchaeota archaeon]|nr:hypothetical protein [Candidatus Woesearchaeota archaeon]
MDESKINEFKEKFPMLEDVLKSVNCEIKDIWLSDGDDNIWMHKTHYGDYLLGHSCNAFQYESKEGMRLAIHAHYLHGGYISQGSTPGDDHISADINIVCNEKIRDLSDERIREKTTGCKQIGSGEMCEWVAGEYD